MRLACRLFIPLQLLLRRSLPRPSPRKEVVAMGCVLAAKDAMTISLRALGRRYRRLGAPIFSSAELARRRERQVKRERNQRSTIKAARLVCLAKAFLRPAIDPVARIGAPTQHQHMKLALANYVYMIEEVTVILAEINAKNDGGISKTVWLFINAISRQRWDIQSSSDYLFIFALSFVIEWLSKMDDNEGCTEQETSNRLTTTGRSDRPQQVGEPGERSKTSKVAKSPPLPIRRPLATGRRLPIAFRRHGG
ncbi:hypothetical protein ALC57_12141 [Trachymyrmex cornetzi]|uniref:Uncharacterized protein n=1 Tax=Trachymyrmex cornetzi TaxID=471704 RepID=A0A195DS13_9HYME|nr:hypothetical protein ALC57_12141 [Trachymyrmex cornetzi]